MEHKENHTASWALWIPSIWMTLIATGTDVAVWVGRGDAEPGTGSPYQRRLLIFLFCFAMVVLYKRRFDFYKAMKHNLWLMVLIFYMFVSIFWTDAPYASLKRWIKELIAVIMAFIILSETNPQNAVQSVLRRSIYILIPLSLVLVIAFPAYGTKPLGNEIMWVGVTTHKNLLGRICYIAVFFFVWVFVDSRLRRDNPPQDYLKYIDMLILGMAVFLLKGPGLGKMMSFTSIATLASGLGAFSGFLLLKKFKRPIGANVLKIVILVCIVLGTTAVFVGGLVFGGEIISSFGREETLTGRTSIWAALLPFVMKEPIIGYGISGFWTKETKAALGNVPSSHNGYLDTLLDYGFVGLFLFTMFFLSSCAKAHKLMHYNYTLGSFWISFLFMIVIYNIAEGSIGEFTNQQMAILLFLSVSSVMVKQDESDMKSLHMSDPQNLDK